MRSREFLKYSAATAAAAPSVRTARADSGVVKVGIVRRKLAPRTRPGTHAFPPLDCGPLGRGTVASSSKVDRLTSS